MRNRKRWYEHGEKNYKYFYNLEKKKIEAKTYNVLKNKRSGKNNWPGRERERFIKQMCTSRNTNPNRLWLIEFFVIFGHIKFFQFWKNDLL